MHGPVNLVRMGMLVDLVNKQEFLFPPFAPSYPQALRGVDSIFERLKEGDVLVVLEAMKMENEILAPKACTVKQVLVSKGSTVDTGATLVVLG